MRIYPLLMQPYFRSGEETPWGGEALAALGKAIPRGIPTGESLEISALPGKESVVRNGILEGAPLSRALGEWGDALAPGAPFPLLIKLLDARETLSVQVHPGDDYARLHAQGKLGKSEAWVVLSARPGARIVYGVNRDLPELTLAAERGELPSALRYVDARCGDVFDLPHGMVHALGAGIVVYEVQQSSDVTYRFWDWGRVDKNGQPRELHIEHALAVTRPELTDALSPRTPAFEKVGGGERARLLNAQYFSVERLRVHGRMIRRKDIGFEALTALAPGALLWDGGSLPLGLGDSVLVPAALREYALEGEMEVIVSGV